MSMIELAERRAFADFLDRLASEPFSSDDWSKHVVNHYHDEVLETFRRNCARLTIDAGDAFPTTASQRSQLRSWAIELRALDSA